MLFGKKHNEGATGSDELKKKDTAIEALRQQLESSRFELDSVNESAQLGIWKCFYDNNGNQRGAIYTDVFRRMLGYDRKELPDTLEALGALIHPDDRDAAFKAFGAAERDKSGKNKYDIEYRIKAESGEYKWFHASGDCLRDTNGTPKVFIGTFKDIDEQKRNEAKVIHDRTRQIAVRRMMSEGSWSLDLTKYSLDDPNAPMVYSGQVKTMVGYDERSSEFPNTLQAWTSKIHPEDVSRMMDIFHKQLRSTGDDSVVETEYRIKHRNGNYLWIHSSSCVVWGDNGKPFMIAGTMLDITEQKNNTIRFKEEMEPNIESLRKGIAEIANNVEKATRQMQEVSTKQEEVSESANGIEGAVTDSMEIIGSIQGIANQTNLLSLNASIEAARAGEAGRGFAVVASEVQVLSNSTKETTEHIAEKLTNVNESVKGILSKINMISDSIAEENEEMSTINATVEELHAAADEIAQMAATLYK